MAPCLLALGTPPSTAVVAAKTASVWSLKAYTLIPSLSPSSCFLSRNWLKSAAISHRSSAEAGYGSAAAPKGTLRKSMKSRVRAKVAGIEAEEDLEMDDDLYKRKRPLRPVVERFNIYHEKNISEERQKELGVSRWSTWECGPGVTCYWQWKVDELVYISKGCVEVVPGGCDDGAFFYAGDLVRFPKWFEASLTFDEDYEQHYKFLAYGD